MLIVPPLQGGEIIFLILTWGFTPGCHVAGLSALACRGWDSRDFNLSNTVISFPAMFFDERRESIYFHGDGINCREEASDEHRAGINGLEDVADEAEAVSDKRQGFANDGQGASDEGEGSSDEGEETSCEHEACIYEGADIADTREDMSSEVEDALAAFNVACNDAATGFFERGMSGEWP